MDDLDRRSEAIEREALISLHEHCPTPVRRRLGLHLETHGDALAAIAEHDPSILLNRVLGFGTLDSADPAIVPAVVEAYRRRGVDRFFFHVYADELGNDELTAFAEAGLQPTRGWMKFRRGRQPVRERETELRVERVGTDRAMHFGQIVATAFGMTPEAAPLLAGLAEDPRWHLLVSYAGDEPAGAGALFIDDGYGWLEWGATDPNYRRRGSQSAIMAERLRIALDRGCEHVFTETGEAVEGDPQHSYRNIERAGFQTSVLRQNYEPATG